MEADCSQDKLMSVNSSDVASLGGVFTGTVRHRRFRTRVRDFRYRVFMTLVDLENVSLLFNAGWFWGTGRALVQFRREDYLPSERTLSEEVMWSVNNTLGVKERGRLLMLTNPRIFGYLINPITVVFCFNKANTGLQAVVLEVTNTPWKERVRYVLPCDPEVRTQRIQFEKAMHVSPFLPMNMHYELRCNTPADKVAVHLINLENGDCVFDATVALNNAGCGQAVKRNVLFSYPWMTMKVFLAIHWQALKLFISRVPFVAHPKHQ
ncbi:MAG: DUF1365 domain-containing protein [Pseudomonadales bacterium]